MIINYNENGYEMLRERIPVIEWYAELQTADGSAACAWYALASSRTTDAGVTPMTFLLPLTGVA
jgi:hypothetical protein